jgi:dihydrofolate synthase / folylpolyglutamate synthase
MSFNEAEAYLTSLGIDAMKSMGPSMHRIEALMEALDHPERRAPSIHITGTNGKTSVARIASALLTASGLNVATYTSPHLHSIRERLMLAGEPIGKQAFGEVFDHLKPYLTHVESRLGEKLTYFEVLTAMFFLWASEIPADALVVEVGLGGRWDATNMVPSSVAVITNIGLDHTALLGEERSTIATEKAGIIKADSDVVTAELTPDLLRVITDAASAVGARVSVAEKDHGVIENHLAVGGRYLSIRGSRQDYDEMFLPLHGKHQGVNAATALEAVTRFLPAQQLDDALVAEGFARTVVPGRLETVPTTDHAGLILDVAHNPDGVSALVSSLTEEFAFERAIFVFGAMEDKDHQGMLLELARVPALVLLTQGGTGRVTLDPGRLSGSAEAVGLEFEIVPDVAGALGRARELAGDNDLICVTGSHYIVGEAREELVPAAQDDYLTGGQ